MPAASRSLDPAYREAPVTPALPPPEWARAIAAMPLAGLRLPPPQRIRERCAACGVDFDSFAPQRANPECVVCDLLHRLYDRVCQVAWAILTRNARAYLKALGGHLTYDGVADLSRRLHRFMATDVGGWQDFRAYDHGEIPGVPLAVRRVAWMRHGYLHEDALHDRRRYADNYTLHVLVVARGLHRLIEERKRLTDARPAQKWPPLVRWEVDVRLPASAFSAADVATMAEREERQRIRFQVWMWRGGL